MSDDPQPNVLSYGDAVTRSGLAVFEGDAEAEIVVPRVPVWRLAPRLPVVLIVLGGGFGLYSAVTGNAASAACYTGGTFLLAMIALFVSLTRGIRWLGQTNLRLVVTAQELIILGPMNDLTEGAGRTRNELMVPRSSVTSVRGDIDLMGVIVRCGDSGAYVELMTDHPRAQRKLVAEQLRRALGLSEPK